MTLNQFIDRIRHRQPKEAEPQMDESARQFIEARRHNLDDWTDAELDEHALRTLEGHEHELREAQRSADEHRRARHKPA
jgi:hypothetical protein